MEEQATIFLIDDEREAIDLLETILKREGYKIMATLSGQEALKIIERESHRVGKWRAPRFDLILLDIMMPGLSGFKICQFIKADENLYYIPVIMATVLEDMKSKITALEFGADDYITKPLIPAELLTTVRARLEMKQRIQELVRSNAELSALNAILTAVSQSLDPAQVLRKALREIAKAMGAGGGVVLLTEEQSDMIEPVAWEGPAPFVPDAEELEGVADILSSLAAHPQPFLSEDITQELAFVGREFKGREWRSLLSVPLRLTEKTVGSLSVYDREPARFTRRDLEWLTLVVDRVGIAYENALLFTSIQNLLVQSSHLRLNSQRKG